jgi:hypothetical protein
MVWEINRASPKACDQVEPADAFDLGIDHLVASRTPDSRVVPF